MFSTPACRDGCLYVSGRMGMPASQNAQIKRTQLYNNDYEAFEAQLIYELCLLQKRAEKKGKIPICRPNGTSDVNWSRIIKLFPDIQFYDYTKCWTRILEKQPDNYHLTFSFAETGKNRRFAAQFMRDKVCNVAVVFDKIPARFGKYKVIDGDKSDFRFDDPENVIVGLTAKGKMKKDFDSGFVVRRSPMSKVLGVTL
jgi:hypothetical protein